MSHTIQQFRSGRGCLSYVVFDNATRKGICIDPSEEVPIETYLDFLSTHSISLLYIIETHTHADHISSAQALKEKTDAQIVQHENAPTSRKDISLSEEDIALGDTTVSVIYTPGHTDDSVCIYVPGAVFTGDTILIGGTGRTDFQAGSSASLHESIWNKILPLGEEVQIYPAHDYKGRSFSTVAKEKETNPRLSLEREAFITAMDSHNPPKPELFDEAIRKNSE